MNTRFLAQGFGVCLLAIAAVPAWSIPLATVGSEDTLLSSTTLADSGEATETAWVESVLGFDIDFTGKIDGTADIQSVDSTNLFAIDFGSADPAYFLIKIGGGNLPPGSDTDFLFQNIASLQYGVFSLADLGLAGTDYTIERISHTSEFGGTGEQVPEPATLALFGMGLAAVGFARRRRSTQSA